MKGDALSTDAMITKIALGKKVALPVECHAPRGPDTVTRVETESDERPIISVRGDDDDITPKMLDDDEHEEYLDKVRLATGTARVSNGFGFGKQRNTTRVEDDMDQVDWHCPVSVARLGNQPGTRALNGIVEDDEEIVTSGAMGSVNGGCLDAEEADGDTRYRKPVPNEFVS